MNLLLKLCKQAKSPNLKIRICSIIGILIRHATVIENELSKLGIPTILLDCMKEKNDKVKRKAISALGEYLFYGATQLDEDPQQNSMWELPNALLQNLIKYLKLPEDEITRFYICKTIENITAQSQITSQKFATPDTMNSLIQIFQNTKLEDLRTCTALCLQNLTRLNYDLLPVLLLDKLGVRTLNIILRDHNQRIQQAFITMLNQFFYVGGNSGIERLILPSQDSPILLTRLLCLLETQHSIIRGKVIIGLVILLRAFPTLLTIIATNKFFQVLERLARDQSKYLFSCLQHLLGFLEEMIPNLLISVHQELVMITEEYSQENQELGQGNASTVVQHQLQQQQQQHKPTYLHNPQNPKSTLTNNLSFIQLIFLFTNSPLFKFSIMSKEYLITIFTFLDLSENLLRSLVNSQQQLSQQLEEFRAYLFLIFESFTTTPKLLDMHYEVFTSYVLPQLFSYINTQNPDLRFHCLKLFTDLSLNLISTEQSNPKLNQLLISEVLPQLKKVLLDQEPMPLYALKLLNILLEKNPPTFTKCLIELGYFQLLMSFYNYQNSRLTSNTLKLIAKIILSNDLSIESLQKQYDFFPKTIKIIINLYQNQQVWAYEDIVEILFNFFLKIIAPMNSSKVIQTLENSIQPLFISNDIAMQLKVQQFDTTLDIIPIIYQIFASFETAVSLENCIDLITLLIFIYGNSSKNDQFLQQDPVSLIFSSLIDPNKSIMQQKLLKIFYWILVLAQGSKYIQQIQKKDLIVIFLQTLKNSENKIISTLAKF